MIGPELQVRSRPNWLTYAGGQQSRLFSIKSNSLSKDDIWTVRIHMDSAWLISVAVSAFTCELLDRSSRRFFFRILINRNT